MPAPTLSTKRRRLVAVSDDEWRTVDELREVVNERVWKLGGAMRRADFASRPFLYRAVNDLMDYGVYDYARAVTGEGRARKGAADGLWRLTPAGMLLRDEILRGLR